MSWNDYYRRRDVIDTALRQARHDPQAALRFAEIEGAEELFGSEENLLLAMHYRWLQALTGRLRAEVAGPEDAAGVPGGGEDDHLEAVSRAWRATVRDNATLRAVLDAHIDRHPALRRAHEAELRVLATTAGLAEPGEPQDEVTAVGNAFLSLLRARSAHLTAPRRTNPVGQLLRKLAPAS